MANKISSLRSMCFEKSPAERPIHQPIHQPIHHTAMLGDSEILSEMLYNKELLEMGSLEN